MVNITKITQIITYSILKPALRVAGSDYSGRIGAVSNFIIASNHVSMYDFLLVHGAVPFASYRKSSTFYTMTANKYLSLPVGGFLLKLNGGFPAKDRGKNDHGIDRAIKILSGGDNLIIFPEGGLPKNGRRREPKNGVTVIQEATSCDIQLVRIEKRDRFLFPKFTIRVGRVVKHTEKLSPAELMKEIDRI